MNRKKKILEKNTEIKKMKFEDLINEMQETYCSRALSDGYLEAHGH